MKTCSACYRNTAPIYYAWCKQCKNAYQRQWRRDNPNWRTGEAYKRHLARVTANNAVKAGRLRKERCRLCGDVNAQMHHPDYDKPLKVTWLCHPCHTEQHRLERRIAVERGIQV